MTISAESIQDFLHQRNVFAVVGASKDPQKYGHKVYRDLRAGGYEVYPVNPRATEILGDRCYPALKDLPVTPDVVDIVVPPQVTQEIVRACHEHGIRKVWMQPGSESEDAIAFCQAKGIAVVHSVCVMVERVRR